MWCKALKSFPYAHDHHVTRTVEEGEVLQIDDGVVLGLLDEGFIDEASEDEIAAAQEGEVVVLDSPPAAPVEIPADWASLHWFKLKVLAEKVTGGAVADKKAAVAAIEAELAKRAEA